MTQETEREALLLAEIGLANAASYKGEKPLPPLEQQSVLAALDAVRKALASGQCRARVGKGEVDVERIAKIAYYARDPAIKMPSPVKWEDLDDEFHKDYFRRIAEAVIVALSAQAKHTEEKVEELANVLWKISRATNDQFAKIEADKALLKLWGVVK